MGLDISQVTEPRVEVIFGVDRGELEEKHRVVIEKEYFDVLDSNFPRKRFPKLIFMGVMIPLKREVDMKVLIRELRGDYLDL